MPLPERLFWLLWIQRLFKPEWILSYYVSALGPLRAVATPLLYLVLLLTLPARERRMSVDRGYLLFYLAIAVSTVFAENTGRATAVLRGMTDSLVFFALSTHYLRDERSVKRLLWLYLGAFVFYGVAGIANRGLVPFHVLLNNEDGFGPFMAMGVPLLYFAGRGERLRLLFHVTTLLCVAGVVASFARGAFLSLCVALLYIWLRHPRKIAIAARGVLLAAAGLAVAGTWLSSSGYLSEISTIASSVRGDSHQGEDRFFLARKALDIFADDPVLGAGPMNFGHMYPKLLTVDEVDAKGIRSAEQLWGRVPHNIYAQILAELGVMGAVAFLAMLAGFARRNRRVAREPATCSGAPAWRSAYAKGILGAMLVYLVNGMFYDILYYHWLLDLLIMNSVLSREGDRDVPDASGPDTRAAGA